MALNATELAKITELYKSKSNADVPSLPLSQKMCQPQAGCMHIEGSMNPPLQHRDPLFDAAVQCDKQYYRIFTGPFIKCQL